MKTWLVCIALAVATIGAVAWTWSRSVQDAPDLAEGLYVRCTRPKCGHFFVIPFEESRTYPRGSQGEGFRCPECNQFAGQIATRCERCGEWLIASQAARGCPRCDTSLKPAGTNDARSRSR